jgi:hypothetical protein
MIKELEDYNWFPQLFRHFQTAYIGSIITWTKFYKPLVPVVQHLLNENKINNIQDLCSGSGMPAVFMQQQLSGDYKTTLSDKFPVQSFTKTKNVIYLKKETDVLLLKPEHDTCYTMYNAFHHFTDSEQQQLLKSLQAANAPFVIAEILEPDFFTMIKIIFTTTVMQLLTAPFVKPFSLLRLLFTYIIPVNLITVTYDGVISVFKSKSAQQYQNLVNKTANGNYEMTVHKIRNWKGTITYIKGNPQK